MKFILFSVFFVILKQNASLTIKSDFREALINRPKFNKINSFINEDYIRRKRYLGLNKKFKLNRGYQECVGPGDVRGHCKHSIFCPMDVFGRARNTWDNVCIIENAHIGVCCPDDIALSGSPGSQLIMNLPGGGNDYDNNDTTTGCGIPEEGRSINGTKNATIQEWPWMAALYRPKEMAAGTEQHLCGGALITDKHVLTAAHCTMGCNASNIMVRLGEYDFSRPTESRITDHAVVEIIQHKGFVFSTYENDIAIIILGTPTTFNSYVWPICMPPVDGNYEGETVVLAGWGKQYLAGPTSEVLRQVAVPVWNHEECVHSFVQRITDDNICAAGYEGGKDSCAGDSGGPLMYQLQNGRWVTIGLVSWGIECGTMGSPAVHTKVSNFLPWIIQNTIAK